MGLIIEKRGDNYVNVNSRDERVGERERGKQLFQQDGIRKKKKTKRCGKKIARNCKRHQ